MATVTKESIITTLKALGIKAGDSVMVHSSFKSFGYVEGGAETVISAFLDVLTEEGTLVFPTLCMEDLENLYTTWHMDKKSDCGYLTEYFRKREGSLRSDQASHSVAAYGRLAKYYTETHGHHHKRTGEFGDTPFAADSPYEKMYNANAKVVLIGVPETRITFKHYVEYRYIEELLDSISHLPEYEEMKNRLALSFTKRGLWPCVNPIWAISHLRNRGLITEEDCGDSHIECVPIKPLVNFMLQALRNGERSVLIDAIIRAGKFAEWESTVKQLSQQTK